MSDWLKSLDENESLSNVLLTFRLQVLLRFILATI